ncbi:MAG TPA: AlkA N-terminal domain-containing protein [Acidimicrobiales bacterium]|nr:AlkA N-terminal domain-containing protein [Acidimicrobiales bacterium]
MELDPEVCQRAVAGKDARFDGVFYSAVVTTGIYCRPSCPALPKPENLRFFPSAAAAQAAGFRACKRCRPDATPGSPEWNSRGDVVARAMRLIADGVVDREGVGGLSTRLGYSPRHLQRQLVEEVGAGPQALARAQRAQTARILLETTELPVTQIAFAAGFGSVRQFNDTVQAVFATSPSGLRRSKHGGDVPLPGVLALRLPFRKPFSGSALVEFLAIRAIGGVEATDGTAIRRSLAMAHGPGVIELEPMEDHVRTVLWLSDNRDLTTAVYRARRLFDLDSDPVAVDSALSLDRILAPLVAERPGTRIPGCVDGAELAMRAVLGQQISLAGARNLAAKLVRRYGKPLTSPLGGVTHLFPDAETIAALNPAELPMPHSRARALVGLATALADGGLVLDSGSDREEVERKLKQLGGIGPWTSRYVSMRVLGDPDVLLSSDLGLRHALQNLGGPSDLGEIERMSLRWRPWRSYATVLLWSAVSPNTSPRKSNLVKKSQNGKRRQR